MHLELLTKLILFFGKDREVYGLHNRFALLVCEMIGIIIDLRFRISMALQGSCIAYNLLSSDTVLSLVSLAVVHL